MELQLLEILSGTFSVLFVIISTIVGLKIALKYFEVKQKVFLYTGIVWILIVEPWWPSSISFLVALITGNGLTAQMYFLIGNIFVPIAVLLWIAAFTELLYKKRQLLFVIIFAIYGALFEIVFFYYLFTDVSMIGELLSPVESDYKFLVLGYLLSTIVVVLVTGTLFARASIKSDNPEVKLKGKLLMAAFISFSFGALLDSAIPLSFITLPITRLLLISSAIEFLGGFILPSWMKKIFLRKTN